MGIALGQLWRLIQSEAASIEALYSVLAGIPEGVENATARELLERIIAEKRGHLNSLQYYCNSICSEKPTEELKGWLRDELGSAGRKKAHNGNGNG